jgi:hypothetical protein
VDELDHAVDRAGQRFQPARHIGFDQLPFGREAGDQFGGRFRRRASRVVLEMPVGGDDIGAEPVEPVPVGDQLFVEEARVPVVEDAADIEDDGIDRSGQRLSPGAP